MKDSNALASAENRDTQRLNQLHNLALQAAQEAAQALKERSEDCLRVNDSTPTDVKIQGDIEAEALIRRRLSQSSPYPVYGEEMGGDLNCVNSGEPYWMVDPLDGTFNYYRGLPLYCVSIGLMVGLEPLLGVVHAFETQECFSGVVGQGCYLNGVLQNPLWAQQRQEACLLTGFPSGSDFSTEAIGDFVQRVRSYKKIRMIGTAALALAYVAVGRADLYLEPHIKLWDVAGGLALVRAAGGVFRITPSPRGPASYYVSAGPCSDWLDQL